jgi:hypothetical protein
MAVCYLLLCLRSEIYFKNPAVAIFIVAKKIATSKSATSLLHFKKRM